MAQSALGGLLGVSDQTVALWERSKSRITWPADHLLRLLYHEHANGNTKVQEFIQHLNELDLREPTDILASEGAQGWDARPRSAGD